MDLQGSLVDTNLRIYPSDNLLHFFKSLQVDDDVPTNVVKFIKGKNYEIKQRVIKADSKTIPVHLDSRDIDNLQKIRSVIKSEEIELEVDDLSNGDGDVVDKKCKNKLGLEDETTNISQDSGDKVKQTKNDCNEEIKKSEQGNKNNKNNSEESELHLTTSDIDWLYVHLQKKRNNGEKNVPYLHVLLEGAHIETPENKILKRNPVLEARCVKLRAQQEAREYRKMTKSVDNVRMRFPEDSISYQLKQVNRQLIAIGQFIISIFAGFLFGFKGVEWTIGPLDIGFRLLLGVMCALIIALAEIYFLAKKLNEELSIPETVQLGGPTKFADEKYMPDVSKKAIDKEHKE